MDDRKTLLKNAVIALEEMQSKLNTVERVQKEPIAIIGLGCRFPGGANNPDTYWQLLQNGVDAIQEVPSDRWDIHDFDGMEVTWLGGFIDQVDRFEPQFFGMSPREAANVDPQQRLVLEVAWEALENAGLAPGQLSNSLTGVFIGISTNDYSRVVEKNTGFGSDVYAATGTALNVAAGRLSYTLGLQGPCAAVDTACSSSLVAVHMGVQSLRNRESNMVLAGGVNLMLTPENFVVVGGWGMLSPDGHCKTFDASANGFVRAEGCGIVVLKRLSDALAANDRILAVIRGSAVNNDGHSSGLTVPNGLAQQAVIRQALTRAEIEPAAVDYIETHGTGTAVGDPIEVEAIGAVFGEGRDGAPLTLGSVKTNIGHLEAASGIAGLIKVVLSMQHNELPPHLHLQERSSRIPWPDFPIVIPAERTPWIRRNKPRIAGVSSFGFSGVNAHVILEEAPALERVPAEVDRPLHLLTLSARSEKSLRELAERYAAYFVNPEAASLADAAFTANTGRSEFNYRAAIIADSHEAANAALSALAAEQKAAGVVSGQAATRQKVAFLFTGQGAQYTGMGRELYDTQPTFRATLDECDRLLRPYLEQPLLSVLYPEAGAESPLNHTRYTQPALFALEYSLAKLWESWGIEPSAVMGHSVGEYVAATLAGVFSLEDGLKLIAARGRLMGDLPEGGQMAAIFAAEDRVVEAIQPYADRVSIGAVNGPGNIVISGAGEAVQAITEKFKAEGVQSRSLVVSHAFHSPLMNPILDEFEWVAGEVRYNSPRLKLVSNVTGDFADSEITTAAYWRSHVREAVRFSDAVQTLHEQGFTLFVEIGPGTTLLDMGQRCVPGGDGLWVPSLRKGQGDWKSILGSLSALYVRGLSVDWAGFDRDYPRYKVALPTYAYQRERYWVQPIKKPRAGSRDSHALLGRGLHSPLIRERVFENTVSPDWPPYLTDHRIYGTTVFPAAGYVEMALAAGATIGANTVENLNILEAFVMPDGVERTTQLVLNPGNPASFQVVSLEADNAESFKLHAKGNIRQAQGTPENIPSLEQVQTRCIEALPVDEYYHTLQDVGLNYGPTFQGLSGLWSNLADCEALGRVQLNGDASGYFLHPGLLDSCFHVLGAAMPENDGGSIYLPIGIERLWFGGEPGLDDIWVWARMEGEADSETLSGQLVLYDTRGRAVVTIDQIRIKRARRETLQRLLQPNYNDWLYELAWEVKPRKSETQDVAGRWLILADNGGVGTGLAAQLEANGAACDVVLAHEANRFEEALAAMPYRGIIHLWGLDHPADDDGPVNTFACRTVLSLAQVLASTEADVRLWVVTRGAVPVGDTPVALAGSPLWGLGRTIAMEQPTRWGGLVDVDAAAPETLAPHLVAEVAAPDGETQVAIRGDVRYAARLSRSVSPLSPGEAYEVVSTTRGVLEGLKLLPLTRREPGPDEVEVQVFASGLNFRDVLNALGLYPGEAPLGNECAGIVVAVGEAVTEFAPGDEVIALGSGVFKTHVVTQSRLVFHKPANLTYAEAVSIPTTFLTAYHGLHNLAGMKPGDRVLIHAAAGGVGLAAVQLAQRAGAEIFATVGSPEKRAFLQSLGVRHIMNSRTLDFADEIMAATDGRGVNIVLNSLADEFIPKSLSILADGGTFLEIGKRGVWSNEQVAEFNPTLGYHVYDLAWVLRDQPGFLEDSLRDLLHDMETGQLSPLPVRAFPVRQTQQAFRFMAQARHIGKVVLTFDIVDNVRPNVTYLITGGLGGLGLKVAESLVERGASHLVLIGRRSPSEVARQTIDRLQADGVQVEVVQADVSDREQVAGVVETIRQNMPPLRGIMHAAGVLDDGILPQQTWERFERVFAPKIDGTWNLHLLTQDTPLDFFVLFSTGAGLLGSAGQGNYAAANTFLDGLAHYRRAYGLSAVSINWGAWAEVGMVATLDPQQIRRLSSQGMGVIEPDQGVGALAQVMAQGEIQVAVLPIDWPKILRDMGQNVPPLLSRFVQETSTAPAAVTKARIISIPGLSPAESVLAEVLHEVLGIEQFNPQDNFLDLGGNSLMAVEVINKIETRTGARLDPATIYVQTLGQLAAGIQITLPEPEVTEPVPAATSATPLPEAVADREPPIFFGAPDEPLYGIYYPPVASVRETAVVICLPWGQEFIRAHRACHQLAVRLSNAGFPVLRFDYYGTGDSGGDDGEHTVNHSLRDIEMAIDEVRARSGVQQVALIGSRLGAAMAVLTASQRNDLSRLVLWDPIVNGSEYLQELSEWHRKTMFYYLTAARPEAAGERTEFLGFAMSNEMQEQLRELNLLALDGHLSLPVMLIERETQTATESLRAHLEQIGATIAYCQVDAPQLWTENPDKALVPHQTLQTIVSWLMED